MSTCARPLRRRILRARPGDQVLVRGFLAEYGQPANGFYDFRAQVYNRAAAGEPGDALVSMRLTISSS